MVKAQTCLHGRPAASFFSRVYAGTAEASTKETSEDTEFPTAPTPKQPATVRSSNSIETSPVATNPSVVGTRAHSLRVAIQDIGSSAYASSSTSNQNTIGGISFTDLTTESATSDPIAAGNDDTAELRVRSYVHQKHHRVGRRGKGRQRTKEWDGWSTSTAPDGVCTLDGELVLLDGVLHDSRVRTWVETALGPLNRRL